VQHNAEQFKKCSSQQDKYKDGAAKRDDETSQMTAISSSPAGHLDLVELLCLHHWIGLGDGIPGCSPVVELAVMLVGIAVQ